MFLCVPEYQRVKIRTRVENCEGERKKDGIPSYSCHATDWDCVEYVLGKESSNSSSLGSAEYSSYEGNICIEMCNLSQSLYKHGFTF